jgi:hypothetical protein
MGSALNLNSWQPPEQGQNLAENAFASAAGRHQVESGFSNKENTMKTFLNWFQCGCCMFLVGCLLYVSRSFNEAVDRQQETITQQRRAIDTLSKSLQESNEERDFFRRELIAEQDDSIAREAKIVERNAQLLLDQWGVDD